jgi:uncharacterized protein
MEEDVMPQPAEERLGSVAALWRYPVKSMLGEELDAVQVSDRGLRGDRAYAVVDSSDGKVASAKNPRKWPGMFAFQAAVADTAGTGDQPPPVRITLSDGTVVTSDQPGRDESLSWVLGRTVTLEPAEQGDRANVAEEYWPDLAGLDHRDTVTDFELPEGTFFDSAVVHVLTTATLARLRELYPQGRFEIPRFRPNVVVETPDGVTGFAENAWIGRTVHLGDAVRLGITGPCPRCVMTTLPQQDLPKDSGILRTAAQHNEVAVGVYASVLQGGRVRRGDPVRFGQ